MEDIISTILNGFGHHQGMTFVIIIIIIICYHDYHHLLTLSYYHLLIIYYYQYSGWWPNPTAWKRNTALYFGFMVVASTYIYSHSSPKTIAYYPGKKSPDAHPVGEHH